MKRISLLIAFFALLFIVLPSLTAQDEKKKDPDKAEKKDEAKKDEPKKTDDAEKKKDEPKKDEPKKEKLNFSYKFVAKIISANAANGREFTVELKEVDPKKVADAQTWQAQRMQQIAQPVAQAQQQVAQAKDPKGRATALQNLLKAQANYQTELYKIGIEMAKKDTYSTKPWDIRAHDDAKVRSNILPVEFDDLGFEKKWTKKEIEERKDKTGLPGHFPSDFEQVKSGQYVEIYMAKTVPAPKDKDQPKKKKAPDDDPPEVKGRPEFMMIVIMQQPAAPK